MKKKKSKQKLSKLCQAGEVKPQCESKEDWSDFIWKYNSSYGVERGLE